MALEIEWIKDRAAFAALGAEWDAILPADSYPFDLHQWHLIWWDAFVGGNRMETCVVRRDGALVGCLPLGWDGKDLSGMVNGHSGVFRPLAVDAEVLDLITEAVVARHAPEVELLAVPAADPSVDSFKRAAAAAGSSLVIEDRYVSPIVDTSGEFERWLKGDHAKWKGRIARYRRKMLRDYEAKLEIVESPTDLGAALAEGYRLEGSGWKGEAGTSIDSSPDTLEFYNRVGDMFQGRGELKLSRIELDGTAVAFSYCLLHGNRLYSLKTGFDESWRKIVPGLVLQLAIVERCFEQGLDGYELLGDTSDWKQKISTDSRAHVDLRLFPGGLVGASRYRYRTSVRPVLKRAYRRLRPRRR